MEQFCVRPRQPSLRSFPRACGRSINPRSFPRANIGFTRCWPYDLRKSAKADLRWESRATRRPPRFALDPRFRGGERKMGKTCALLRVGERKPGMAQAQFRGAEQEIQ